MSSPFLMPSHINPFLPSGPHQCTVTLPPLYHKSGSSAYFGMDTFDPISPPLDSLDSLSISDFKPGMLLHLFTWAKITIFPSVSDTQISIFFPSYCHSFRLCSKCIPSTGNYCLSIISNHHQFNLCYRLISHCFSLLLQINNNHTPMGMAVGMPDVKGLPAAVDLAKNPLAETHEFKQACSVCYVKTGEELF